jgi:hypothetical protein
VDAAASGFASWGCMSFLLLRLLGSACSSPPGFRPGSRITFFASPKKVIKERRPDGCAPEYRGSLRYSQTGGQPDNSPLGTGTQTSPAVAGYRSYPGLLRCSAQPTGAEQQPYGSLRIASMGRRKAAPPDGRCEASRVVFPVGGGEERSGPRVAARRAVERSCLSTDRREGEFFVRPRVASTAADPVPRAPPSGRLSLPTFFGEAKKVGRLPGRNPGGLPSKEQEQQEEQ